MPVKSHLKLDVSQDDELEQLKQLLFDKEFQEIETLRKHLLDPQQRMTDTAQILADAIKIAAINKQKLADALNDPVDECIRSIVRQKPQEFADSLFPVMGPAIRKSISETLKSFVQSTNQMIEQSMSLKSLRWRWEAKRSGVPFSEIVLKHSLLYRVEEVFLIQQGTGLLIEHVSHPDVIERDSDAISAMLTVIRDFSRDSFSTNTNDSLQTVEFGEHTLWMFDGPKAILACVNRGLVPNENHEALQAVLEQFHAKYSTEIETFSGDRSQHPEFQALLETCLTQRSKEETTARERKHETRRWFRNPLIWLLLVALLLGGCWSWIQYDKTSRINELLTELKSMAGIVIIGSHKKDNTLVVTGLRDPLSSALTPIARKHGFSDNEIQFEMALFQSLDPPLALQRAVRLLNVPETVALAIEDDQLVLNGVASRQWLESVRGLLDRVPGFRMINIDRVKVDDSSRLRSIRHQLRAPETVQLELSYNTLFVTGTASAEWIKSLKQRCLSLFPDLNLKTTFHGDKLLSNEGTQLKILIQQLDGMSFYFSRGVTLTTAQQSSLEEKIDRLRKLVLAIDDVSTGVKFIVRGYTDGSGSVESNKALQLMRANYVKQFMLKAGISPASITVISGRNSVSVLQVNPALRRADIEIIADDVV